MRDILVVLLLLSTIVGTAFIAIKYTHQLERVIPTPTSQELREDLKLLHLIYVVTGTEE